MSRAQRADWHLTRWCARTLALPRGSGVFHSFKFESEIPSDFFNFGLLGFDVLSTVLRSVAADPRPHERGSGCF